MITQKIKEKLRTKNTLDIELDCEYYDSPFDSTNRETISTQIRESDLDSIGMLFSHSRKILDCPYRSHGNPIIDYLNQLNLIETEDILEEEAFQKLCTEGKSFCNEGYYNLLIVNIWTYYGIVDWARAFYGKDGEFINDVILGKYKGLKIVQKKRLETAWYVSDEYPEDYIPTRRLIKIPGISPFIVCLRSYDISAMLDANKSFSQVAEALGVNIPDKSLMDDYKTDMRQAVEQCPQQFIKYALGDLRNKKFYDLFNYQFKQTLNLLSLTNNSNINAKLTIGSTVNQMIKLYLEKEIGVELRKKEMKQFHWDEVTAQKLLKDNNRTRQLLGKIDGGRCNNNKPWIANDKEKLCDVDIASCYSSAMSSLSYPFGEPLIIDHKHSNGKIDDRENLYTLGSFLEEFKDELVEGLWAIRVSTPEGYTLKHQQDLIQSFIPPKNMEAYQSASDQDGTDEVQSNSGDLKCFFNQIINGIINSDILEILQKYSNSKAWKEYIEKLEVVAAVFYPKSARANSVEEYFQKFLEEKGETNTQVICKGTNFVKRTEENHNHVWVDVPLKTLISTLQAERNKAEEAGNYPLKETLKTTINTIYGDLVSPKFHTSNVVLAQNITARSRSMAYLMEKGLNMYLTITDGGIFNPQKVITTGKRKPTVQNLAIIKTPKEHKLAYKSLQYTTKDELEKESLNHIAEMFPEITIIKNQIFNLVIKVEDECDYLAQGGSFQGSANHQLNFQKVKTKMRSYSDKKSFTEEGQPLKIVRNFLNELYNNPSEIKRTPTVYQTTILKTKQYSKNYQKYKKLGITSGYTIKTRKKLLEFTLNQFNYRTFQQYKAWEKEINKLKSKYDQSLEMFYINSNGSLNYQQMMEEVFEDIQNGENKPRVLKDKNRSRKYKNHPHHTTNSTTTVEMTSQTLI